MTAIDLDAALLGLTDAEINAALVRRAQAKVVRARRMATERMARLRERKCDANGDAGVTLTVTPETRHIPSSGDANGDAGVTLTVTQNGCISAPSQVSPLHPPSFPTPPNLLTPPAAAKISRAVPRPEDVPLPPRLAEISGFSAVWQTFIVSRRRIGQPMTDLAAERLLKKLSERTADAVRAVDMAIEKQWQGFNWKWFDNENAEEPAAKFRGDNGRGAAGKPASRPPEQRDYAETTI